VKLDVKLVQNNSMVSKPTKTRAESSSPRKLQISN